MSLGSYRADPSNLVGGPLRLTVSRDMDVPADSLELLLSDRSGISTGDTVTIELGDEKQKRKVFTGEVAEIAVTAQGARVRALGKMNALLNLRISNTYQKQAAGDIVRDLVRQAGLTGGTIDDGPKLPMFVVDQSRTAYDYARDLAARLGYEIYSDREGKVMFHALGKAAGLDSAGGGLLGAATSAVTSAASALLAGGGSDYKFGKHLVRSAVQRVVNGPDKVEVGGESPMSSKGDSTSYWLTTSDNENHGSSGDGKLLQFQNDPAARTQDLANRFAAGYRATRMRSQKNARITILGRSDVELGDSTTVSDVPDKTGNAQGYIRGIRHRYASDGGFLTDLHFVVEGDE